MHWDRVLEVSKTWEAAAATAPENPAAMLTAKGDGGPIPSFVSGGGSIPTAFQLSIARCRNCQLPKNIPPKTESRTIPARRPLHSAPQPSKRITSMGRLTSVTAGGLPEPVIIQG
uniref:Uncharacterized protein n=1 Tax=Opuntia streptacantha TaxID=393608 RepID=A0A7C9F8Z2_OPUST